MFERFEGATGFIFDCDGTLLDSMRAWDEVEARQFRSTGHDFTEAELEEIRSAPMSESSRILHERYGLGTSAQDVMDTFDSFLLDFYESKVEPLPGAREFVESVRRRGVACSVVSSSPDRYIFAGLRRCGMFDDFAAVISTDSVGISKSDPGIYRVAIERMGSDLATTWGADDAIYAVRVMKGMGMRAIGVYDGDGTGTFGQLEQTADIAIRSFFELLD